MNKIGVLGGTFDPPHGAHLEIARRSISQFGLNKVIFIPSGNPWQKKDSTSFLHRFEMTKILINESEFLEISDIEKSEENPSYTYETLLRLDHPKEDLYFILGSDTAMNIKTWKNHSKLSELTNFLIALRREDSNKTLDEYFPFEYSLIDGEKVDLSSSTIRNKLKRNELNDDDLSKEVLNYIKDNNLY